MLYLGLRLGGLLVLTAALAGCGGGGGGSPSVNPEPPAPPLQTNNPPVPTKETHTNLQLSARVAIRVDMSMGGTVFRDPDGDPLTYTLEWNGNIIGDGAWLSLPAGDPAKPWDPANLIGTAFDVTLRAYDPAGLSATHFYVIERLWNRPPTVQNPNLAAFPAPNEHVSRDLLQGGTTFVDPDGDPLTYGVEVFVPPGQTIGVRELTAEGELTSIGLAARFEITATDSFGATATDAFVVATPVSAPGNPTLPVQSLVYEDANLPLPWEFRVSAKLLAPFWDTASTTQLAPSFPTNAGATLGRVLFYDKRISVTNTHSCASCHLQSLGFTTAERFPTGVLGAPLKRNAMALANTRYNFHER